MTEDNQSSTGDPANARILKSTTIIGGSSLVNILFRIIEAKAVALLVGPGGVGLMGLFQSVVGLATTISGMGIGTSGVPPIAEAVASGDQQDVARRVFVYRRLTLLLAGTGALVFFLLRRPIAQITFGNQNYVIALGLLALVPLLGVVSASQSGLIRAYRHIGDLAKATMWGAGVGTFVGLPLLLLWRESGIAPYLIVIAGTTLLASWWYARKISSAFIALTWSQVVLDSRPLLTLGFAFMISGFVSMASAYLVKVLINYQLGLEATGLFQASSTLSNVYVGFILGAMGADFLPHLAALAHDDQRSTDLINSQVMIGMLLAGPGLMAILALGSWVLTLLYSSEFIPAFTILRWQVLGTFLRVVTWPIGYLMIARGQGRLFFAAEASTNAVYVGAVYLFLQVENWGVAGAGLAFFVMYLYLFALATLVARRLIAFRWSHENIRVLFLLTAGTSVVFAVTFIPNKLLASGIGLLVSTIIGLYAVRRLISLVGLATIQTYWRRLRGASIEKGV